MQVVVVRRGWAGRWRRTAEHREGPCRAWWGESGVMQVQGCKKVLAGLQLSQAYRRGNGEVRTCRCMRVDGTLADKESG